MSQETDAKTLLLKEKLNQEEAEAFRQEHKEAFRVAFDLLKDRCFPPMRDADYFTAVGSLVDRTIRKHPGNRLLPHLCIAVMDYLGELSKDLPEKEEQDDQD